MAGVEEKKSMAAVDEELKSAAAEIAKSGITVTIKCDWEAFDKLPFDQLGKNRVDTIQGMKITLESLGMGFNRACEDADYKSALSEIKKITFVPTNNTDIQVKATAKGAALTIEDYSFGSSRSADDFKRAIEKSVG